MTACPHVADGPACAACQLRRITPPIEEQLPVFNLVATIRRLRAELEPFAVSPSVRRIKQLRLQEQGFCSICGAR